MRLILAWRGRAAAAPRRASVDRDVGRLGTGRRGVLGHPTASPRTMTKTHRRRSTAKAIHWTAYDRCGPSSSAGSGIEVMAGLPVSGGSDDTSSRYPG